MFRMCWHDWNKWSGVKKDYSANMQQFRSCKKCNKIIKRKAFHIVAVDETNINKAVDNV